MIEEGKPNDEPKIEKEEKLVCFNPRCTHSKNRFFNQSHPHSQIQSCKTWFYKINDLFENKSSLNGLKNEVLFFDFVKEPIESLRKLNSLAQFNWKHTVSGMFDQVWKELRTQIEQSQKLFIMEVEKHLEGAKVYDNIIKALANGVNGEATSKEITQLLSKSRIPTQPIQIFHPSAFQTLMIASKQAFKVANDSFTNLQVDLGEETLSLNSTSQKTCIEEQMRKFEIWISEEVDNPFSKVQVLAATFNVIPNSYTVQGKNVGLECFLCRTNLTTKVPDNNKKNAKKVVTKIVLEHLMSNHKKEVFTNYRKKISKSLIKEFTMDEIIEEIKEGKHKRIEIIDRENSGTYVAEENGQFIFEVVSKRNASLARGNYVVANSIAKDSADIVISFIIKELFNMKNMTVRLVTNDHFGTTIEEICQSLKYDFKVISRIKK